ncbi:hypothetical protein BOTNAR_0045g00460 [Botryotinia narcissicola]|uniref:Uncharacterized protein n=1 Tax=Botryotinia narcissicola TaxID=278944 RepID=A0A4Z1J100_9HELO|nr:hypothetical protein BOTNAR_0045g00460 [Botryotinia narcissicola]
MPAFGGYCGGGSGVVLGKSLVVAVMVVVGVSSWGAAVRAMFPTAELSGEAIARDTIMRKKVGVRRAIFAVLRPWSSRIRIELGL